MRRFLVEIRGENFLLNLDGEHAKFGLSALRVVKARNAAEAERIALIEIHHELNQSSNIIKDTPDAPRVFIERVEKLKFYRVIPQKQVVGFEFISEDQHPE